MGQITEVGKIGKGGRNESRLQEYRAGNIKSEGMGERTA